MLHYFQSRALVLALICLALMLASCGRNPIVLPGQASPVPTVGVKTGATIVVVTATSPAAIATDTAAASSPATVTPLPPPTASSTNTPAPAAPSSPTPLPASPTAAQGGVAHVKIFLIAMNDNGKSGPLVGCGDSAVAVDRQITPTRAPLTAALNELFSIHDQFYGQSGLYNALYQSDLHLESVAIVNAKATIKLTGKLSMGGECDDPRVGAQITNTALQFPTVRSVDVFLNGTPLKNVLSGK